MTRHKKSTMVWLGVSLSALFVVLGCSDSEEGNSAGGAGSGASAGSGGTAGTGSAATGGSAGTGGAAGAAGMAGTAGAAGTSGSGGTSGAAAGGSGGDGGSSGVGGGPGGSGGAPGSLVYNEEVLPNENSYAQEDWDRVDQAYIYFGHQSVGSNIIDGLNVLAAGDSRYEVHQQYIYSDFEAYQGEPALGESGFGTNGDPDSKIAGFDSMMHSGTGLGGRVDLAFYKFCFVDIDETTNVQAVFDSYISHLESLEQQYPTTLFIYTTVPLGTGGDYDVARNDYNAKVRSYVSSTGKPLYDLASVEATRANGERCTFDYNGQTLDRLCDEYSAGDPHLNSEGGQRAAKVMMLMFVDLLKP